MAQSTKTNPFNWVSRFFRKYPSKKPALLFGLLAALGRKITKPWICQRIAGLFAKFFSNILSSIAPTIPFQVTNSRSYSDRWTIIKFAFPLSIFFSFGMNFILTWVYGTLKGSDPSRMYFLDDYHNIFQYIFAGPAYFCADICLIAATIGGWNSLKKLSDEAVLRSLKQPSSTELKGAPKGLRFATFITLSILITGVFITTYINDILSDKVPVTYWFSDAVSPNRRVLNEVGAYYLLMNAVGLFVTCVTALCYLTMSIEVVRLGRSIGYSRFAQSADPKTSSSKLANALNEYCWCFCLAKIAVVGYAIVIWSWGQSKLGTVQNVDIAIIALALFGLFVIPLPRLYIEYKWNRVLRTTGPKYIDFRSHGQIHVSQFANVAYVALIVFLVEERFGAGRIAAVMKFVVGEFGI